MSKMKAIQGVINGQQFDTGYWKKWHKRWIKIAEKFKEAK